MNFINKYFVRLELFVCVGTFSIMLLLVFINVLSRFLLHMSLSFSEEIVTGLFVLASLAGASIAIRDNSHLGLDFFTSFLPKSFQSFLKVLANILGIVMCCIILYFGIYMVIGEYSSHQLTATMQWPEWIYGMTIPLGSSMLIFRYCFALYCIAVNSKKQNVEEDA